MRYRHAPQVTLLAVLAVLLIIPRSVYIGAASSASALDVVVSEIAWMGTTASSTGEWIELYNNTGREIDLTGWTLQAADGKPSIALSGTIPAGGHFLPERTDDDSEPSVAADLIYTGGLSDGGEHLVLRDATFAVIDQVDCSSGWFAGHVDARVSMTRVDTRAEGSQASNWTHGIRCSTPTNSAGDHHVCVNPTLGVPQPLDYDVYFNERATTARAPTAEMTEMERALLSLIERATTRIDVALYGLSRQNVVDALIAAHNRGVTVRVVGDDEAASEPGYGSRYQALADAGITVVVDAAEAIQHNKFLVVDGRVLWTGSTNFTSTGLTLHANNSLVITDTLLSSVYTKEFEEMWSGAFHGSKADNTSHLVQYDGTFVESYFSPTDLTAFEVWDELGNADETIHFAVFFWTDELLSRRVAERIQAGVEVYGVWDQFGETSEYSEDEWLCAAGARIGIENLPGKVHHKFAVIDVEGDDPVVIVGSYNWTKSGAYKNDENTLIIHDRELARTYYAEWQRLWETVPAERVCSAARVYLPVVLYHHR